MGPGNIVSRIHAVTHVRFSRFTYGILVSSTTVWGWEVNIFI